MTFKPNPFSGQAQAAAGNPIQAGDWGQGQNNDFIESAYLNPVGGKSWTGFAANPVLNSDFRAGTLGTLSAGTNSLPYYTLSLSNCTARLVDGPSLGFSSYNAVEATPTALGGSVSVKTGYVPLVVGEDYVPQVQVNHALVAGPDINCTIQADYYDRDQTLLYTDTGTKSLTSGTSPGSVWGTHVIVTEEAYVVLTVTLTEVTSHSADTRMRIGGVLMREAVAPYQLSSQYSTRSWGTSIDDFKGAQVQRLSSALNIAASGVFTTVPFDTLWRDNQNLITGSPSMWTAGDPTKIVIPYGWYRSADSGNSEIAPLSQNAGGVWLFEFQFAVTFAAGDVGARLQCQVLKNGTAVRLFSTSVSNQGVIHFGGSFILTTILPTDYIQFQLAQNIAATKALALNATNNWVTAICLAI